jgi:dephospho-CoA kinase
MAKPVVIGLTGGIGSGKTTVAGMLAELGARVIDADKIGHEVYRPGSEGFRRVVEAFGPGVVAPDGTIDRRALGTVVFADAAARARLDAVVHPLIAEEIGRRVAGAGAEGGAAPIVIEAAILIEAGWRSLVDRLWVVSVDRETATARLLASRPLTPPEVQRRIAAQMPDEERRRLADVVIENRGTPAVLRTHVERAWREVVG